MFDLTRHSFRWAISLCVLGLLVVAPAGVPPAVAEDSCGAASGGGPLRRVDSKIGAWAVSATGIRDCRGGVEVEVIARQPVPGELVPGGRIERPLGPTGMLELPIYCRRDDYAFLPPNALGGLPCLALTPTDHIDPYALAVQLAASLPPPAVHISMNPQRGLVAVPTWFWVEGYDGGSLSSDETVLEAHERCHLAVVRNDDGSPVQAPDGRAELRRECTVETTTFSIEVQLWPKLVAWDFGDQTPGTAVACSRSSPCRAGLGEPFVDARHPSPIQHPYQWSSLGVQGPADAYRVQLAITFGAAFRVSVDGATPGGWQDLPDRALAWSATHQVQEAQAVLTRP